MTKLFSVGNKAKRGYLIAARDNAHAAQIALSKGFVKDIANATVVDVTERAMSDNLQDLLDQDIVGWMAKRISPNKCEWIKW